MRLLDVAAAVAPPVCVACGAWAGAAEPLCGVCRGRVRWLAADPVDGVWAPVAYDGPARRVVAALKFRSAIRAADARVQPGGAAGFGGGAAPWPPVGRRARARGRARDADGPGQDGAAGGSGRSRAGGAVSRAVPRPTGGRRRDDRSDAGGLP